MVDWVSGMADASVSERDSGSVLVRVPGSPDVLKEAPVSGFLTKDASGNTALGNGALAAYQFAIFGSLANFFFRTLSTGNQIGTDNNQPISLLTNGSEKMRVAANGNVGIGTSSVAGKLHVVSTAGFSAPSLLCGDGVGDFRIVFNTALYSNVPANKPWLHTYGDLYIGSDAANTTFVLSGGTLQLAIGGGVVRGGSDAAQSLGTGAIRWSTVYAATGTINTSDERSKTDIGEIPDAWLDAWAGVEWRRFKMVGGNRWHVGLVAQQVHAAFEAHDLDAFEIGLCCFDAWEEQREPIFEMVTKTRKAKRTEQVPAGEDENGEPLFKLVEVTFDEEYEESIDTGKTRVTLEAGDRWGLRYDECQAIEAAYQRRELSRMAARLAALENGGQGLGA